MLDFRHGVKVIVMSVEYMMKPKNSKLWVGVSTDFLSLMLNPKAWRRETVALISLRGYLNYIYTHYITYNYLCKCMHMFQDGTM